MLVLAVLVSGVLAQAAAVVRCEVACGAAGAHVDDIAAVDECCTSSGAAGVADEHSTPADPRGHEDGDRHGSGCCPLSCQACVARALFVTPVPLTLPAESAPQPQANVPVADARPHDVGFSIFHPPKA